MSEGKKKDVTILKRLFGLTKPLRSLFYSMAFLAVILAPISIIRPALINRMVDDYILKFDTEGLLTLVGVLIGVLILESFLRYFFIYGTNLLGQMIIKDLRVDTFRHICSLRPKYFDETPIGQNTTRTVNDIESINQVFSQGAISILADLLAILAILVIMFYTSWKLALVCLVTLPVMIIGSYVFKEKVKASFEIVRTQVSRMNSFLQERISGMLVVQLFNIEEREKAVFEDINRDYLKANLNTVKYYAIFFPFVEIMSALAIGIMVWYSAKGVLSEEISPGMLVVFPIYINMLFRPVRMIADRFNTLQMGMVAADRVFGLLDDNDKISNDGITVRDKFDGNIAFENVEFAYNKEQPVLKNVSFKIQAGETLAVVGSTGSGKTTIINLLNRFYEIDRGRILLDGIDIRELELNSLRKRMAVVLQDVFLFSGSLLDNIRIKDEQISRAEIVSSAKLIGAHKFFEDIPGGYDSYITERGSNLSMGQRQLISFVRALVFQPDILILDEATSSIDTETESTIQFAIEKLIEKRTSIIIAHRLSTIQHADKILVMDKGKVVEFGTLNELLEIENGYYRKLHNKQVHFEAIKS